MSLKAPFSGVEPLSTPHMEAKLYLPDSGFNLRIHPFVPNV